MGVEKTCYTGDVPEDRENLIHRLLEMKRGTVMFVGDMDTGKTTTLSYIANRLIEEGRRVAIVDCDVGQKGVLPPATISLALPGGHFSGLSELKGKACYFLGTTSPGQYIGEMVVGTWRMVSLAKNVGAEFVLVDTTGFVHGRGVDMKRMKVELLRPEVTVFLERCGELKRLKRAVASLTEVIELEVSDKVRRHTRNDRRAIRGEKWRRYFSKAKEVKLSGVVVTGTSLFSGRPLDRRETELLESIYGWVTFGGWMDSNGTCHVVKGGGRPLHYLGNLHAVDVEKLSNLLVGLIDDEGLCRAVGVLKVPNFRETSFSVLAPMDDVEEVREVRFGRIRVTEHGEEIELLRRDEL